MVKLMIVTHGSLANAFKESTKMFFNDVDDIESIGLYATESSEDLKSKIMNSIEKIDDGDGVLIFVDFFGGSPFNVAASIILEMEGSHKLECLAGVNMPLLMEAVSMREHMELSELVSHLESISANSISNLRTKFEL